MTIIVSNSCERKDFNNLGTFSFNDFQKIDMSLQREFLTDDPDVVGNPLNIKAINDSIVAISRMNENRHVILFNIKSGKTQTSVFQGMGPSEMLNVCGMSVDNHGNLWLAGQIDRKVMTSRWDEDEDENAVTELKIHSPSDMLRGVSDGNGGIIAMPAIADSVRLVMIDHNGAKVDSITIFPHSELPQSIQPNNFIFQADLCYSPKQGKAVTANRSWNEIEIYNIANHDIISIKAPLKEEIKIEKKVHGDAYSCEPKPFWHLFSGVSCGDKYFLVGYVGVKIQSDEDYSKYCNQLLEFNWNGKPNRTFIPATEAMLFDVDYDNGYIYTIENNPDPTLYRYKITL